jgi:hypothetical protein
MSVSSRRSARFALAAAAWLLPPPLRPGALALAALLASAEGRAGGVLVAAVAAFTPVPGPVRAAIVVTQAGQAVGERPRAQRSPGRAVAVLELGRDQC